MFIIFTRYYTLKNIINIENLIKKNNNTVYKKINKNR